MVAARTIIELNRIHLAGLVVAASLFLACGSHTMGDSGVRSTSDSSALAGSVTAQLASSEIILGPNRFVRGLLDSAGKPVPDATARLTFFDLSSPQAVEKGTAGATFRAPAREAGLAETIAVILPNGQRRIQVNAPSDVGIYDVDYSFDRMP